MKSKRAFVSLMLIMLLVACSIGTEQATSTAHDATDKENSLELALPTVPEDLTTNEARVAYVLAHFWDNLEPTDTVRSLNGDFVEQNFANFVSLFPVATEENILDGVTRLMEKLKACPAAYRLMAETARKYLYEPNSPMYNEGYYETFVNVEDGAEELDASQSVRVATEKVWIGKNREGTTATDFKYRRSDGTVTTLRKTPIRDKLLLVLYDPECEQCHDIIQAMGEDVNMNWVIGQRRLEVLAINIVGATDSAVVQLPYNWQRGVDVSGIEDNELYVIRATPALYVLDKDYKVLVKDCQPAVIEDLVARLK